MITAHLKFKTKELLITNIYSLNSPTTAFFQEVTRWILKKPQYPQLIGGDFNMVLRKEEDISTRDLSYSRDSTGHFSLLEQFQMWANLIHPWRLSHAMDKEYTFYSAPHKSFTRLDYFFTSPSLLPHVREATIHELVISDHSPIFVQFSDFLPKDTTKIWRFPYFLAHDDQLKRVLQEAWEELTDKNRSHSHLPNLLWDAGKASLKGKIRFYAYNYKANSPRQHKQASICLHTAQALLAQGGSQDYRKTWHEANAPLTLWQNNKSA